MEKNVVLHHAIVLSIILRYLGVYIVELVAECSCIQENSGLYALFSFKAKLRKTDCSEGTIYLRQTAGEPQKPK